MWPSFQHTIQTHWPYGSALMRNFWRKIASIWPHRPPVAPSTCKITRHLAQLTGSNSNAGWHNNNNNKRTLTDSPSIFLFWQTFYFISLHNLITISLSSCDFPNKCFSFFSESSICRFQPISVLSFSSFETRTRLENGIWMVGNKMQEPHVRVEKEKETKWMELEFLSFFLVGA